MQPAFLLDDLRPAGPAAESRGGIFRAAPCSLFGSSRVHKTNPMEPPISGNIAHLGSLSARAMQTT
jgi:hypothetical protein